MYQEARKMRKMDAYSKINKNLVRSKKEHPVCKHKKRSKKMGVIKKLFSQWYDDLKNTTVSIKLIPHPNPTNHCKNLS